MDRIAMIEEAVRVRPSKAAMEVVRREVRHIEAMAETPREKLFAGGLRVLIEMHDKLPPSI